MFQIGDLVVYQTEGVCKVADITMMDLMREGKKRPYLVLNPRKNPASKIYCPSDNPKIMIRKVLTREEAEYLLDEIPDFEVLWIENEKQREETYKSAIRKGDCGELIRVIKTLYQRKKARVESGKKMTSTDERYFKAAKTLLYEELAVALDKEEKDMEAYITQYLTSEKKKV